MANVAKLKKKAAEFELKRQFDKALAVYIEILDDFDQNPDEVDVALFNRVGDMLLRQGNVADAVDYYERAVDRYADGGFFNNAIALCNKILRQSPGRASIYYKLGKISAQKGFKNDAKQNFLEYADRMQKSGRMDEAFRALKEFADLCPDQDDIRLMLAEQLSRQERGGEAIEQLQTLFDRYSSDGRDAEASATLERIKSIDPTYQPRSTGPQKAHKGSDLVFLDVYGVGDTSGKTDARVERIERAAEPPPRDREVERKRDVEPDQMDSGIIELEPTAPEPLMGLETTSFAPPGGAADVEMLDLEPTSFDSGPMDAIPARGDDGTAIEGLESTSFDAPGAAAPPDDEESERGELDFLIAPTAPPAAKEAPSPDFDFLLPDQHDSASPHQLSDEDPGAAFAPELLQGDPASGDAFSSLDFNMTPAVEPGTDASVPEFSIEEALQGLPMMDFEAPVEPVVDEARIRQSVEVPSLSFDEVPPLQFEQPARPSDPLMAGDEASSPAPDERVPGPAGEASDRLRRSTIAAEHSVELLVALAEADPEDMLLRRRLAEARLESGDREGGLADLDAAMAGHERMEELTAAASVADEIARLIPDSVRIHQKRVEYAFRTNERPRLVGAYLDLAAALLGDGQTDKARTVYKRVLDLAPDDIAAQAGLAALTAADAPPAPAAPQVDAADRPAPQPPAAAPSEDAPAVDNAVPPAPAARTLRPFRTGAAAVAAQKPTSSAPPPAPERPSAAMPTDKAPPPPPTEAPAVALGGASANSAGDQPRGSGAKSPPPAQAAPASDDAFINLGDWLRSDQAPRSTRMVVEEKEPTGDEEADFAEMLRRFKQGVAENVDAEDHQSHYDLGVAFKEMGLIDEAISEFQRALRAPTNRLPTYEALGQCFVEKGQHQVARAILSRALSEPDISDEQLIGVLYLLGHASESLGHHQEALAYYQRVFVVDIQFRDVADRLTAVEQASR